MFKIRKLYNEKYGGKRPNIFTEVVTKQFRIELTILEYQVTNIWGTQINIYQHRDNGNTCLIPGFS